MMKKIILLLYFIFSYGYSFAQDTDSLATPTQDSLTKFLELHPFVLENYKSKFYYTRPFKKFAVDSKDTTYKDLLQALSKEDELVLLRQEFFNFSELLHTTYFYGIQAVTSNYTSITLFIADETWWINYILLLTYSTKGNLVSCEIVACMGGDGGDYTISKSKYLNKQKLRVSEENGYNEYDEKTELTYEVVSRATYNLVISKNGQLQKQVLKKRLKRQLAK